MKKMRFGRIHADFLTMDGALDRIVNIAASRKGGYVVTPNVDHIVMAERDDRLLAAYEGASLSLADGKPLLWMSRLAGHPLPEKISGSDLVKPLLRRAEREGLTVYFLGSAPGVGKRAAEILLEEMPELKIVGVDSPEKGFDADDGKEAETYAAMAAADPDIALIALGAPKQELLMRRWKERGCRTVMLGIGASLDFIAGAVRRSPRWMSNLGLEWLYRLSQDPKRLAYRYLVRDAGILPVFARMLAVPKDRRVYETEGEGQ